MPKSQKENLERNALVNEFEMYCHDEQHSGEEYMISSEVRGGSGHSQLGFLLFPFFAIRKGEVTQVELTAVDESGKGQLMLSETDLTPAMGGADSVYLTNDPTGGSFTQFYILGYRKSETVLDAVIEARPTGNEGVRAPKRGVTVMWVEHPDQVSSELRFRNGEGEAWDADNEADGITGEEKEIRDDMDA